MAVVGEKTINQECIICVHHKSINLNTTLYISIISSWGNRSGIQSFHIKSFILPSQSTPAPPNKKLNLNQLWVGYIFIILVHHEFMKFTTHMDPVHHNTYQSSKIISTTTINKSNEIFYVGKQPHCGFIHHLRTYHSIRPQQTSTLINEAHAKYIHQVSDP